MTEDNIRDYFAQNNYDLRRSGNARWIDQKCTPDVLWSVSDFVINYIDNISDTFTVSNIWKSDYAKLTIRETFSKPETDDASAENEYDKVFSQPLRLLCYSGVIEDISTGSRHIYRVKERQILEYISINDVRAMKFLQLYVEKVLTDSDLFQYFEGFFEHQDKLHFAMMKSAFARFYHDYTPVQGKYEPSRILSKVLNPLAFKYGKCGTEGGHMSKNPIIRADLMYNRDNFRDVYRDKPKGIARKDWLAQHPDFDVRVGYFEQMMNAAKRLVKTHNDYSRAGVSELTQFSEQHNDMVQASQIHHIFPKNEFPDIKYYPENLIALTPNQHFMYAHPNNNTQIVDVDAQKILLIAKVNSIKKNLTEEENSIYTFNNLLSVLCIGWNDENVAQIEQDDYIGIIHSINCHYDSNEYEAPIFDGRVAEDPNEY